MQHNLHPRHKRHQLIRRRLDEVTTKSDLAVLPADVPNSNPLSSESHTSTLWLYIGMTFILTIVVTIIVVVGCMWTKRKGQKRKNEVASHPWTARYVRTNNARRPSVSSKEAHTDVSTSRKHYSILFLRRNVSNSDTWTSPGALHFPTPVVTSPCQRISYRDESSVLLQSDNAPSFDQETAYSGMQSSLTTPSDDGEGREEEVGLGISDFGFINDGSSKADKYARLMPRQSVLAMKTLTQSDDFVEHQFRKSNGSDVFLAKAATFSIQSSPSTLGLDKLHCDMQPVQSEPVRDASCADLLEEIFDECNDASVTGAFNATIRSITSKRLTRALVTSGELFSKLVRRSEIRRKQSRCDALPAYMHESTITPFRCEQESNLDQHKEGQHCLASSTSLNTTLQTTIQAMLEIDDSDIRFNNEGKESCTDRRAQSMSTLHMRVPSTSTSLSLSRAQTVSTTPSDRQKHMLAAINRRSDYASPTLQLVELYDVLEDESYDDDDDDNSTRYSVDFSHVGAKPQRLSIVISS
jgi:hypothetical protein